MKRSGIVAVCTVSLLIALVLPSHASIKAGPLLGLRFVEWVDQGAGTIGVGAGVGSSGDITYVGSRFSYGWTDDVRLFGDIGYIDIGVGGFDSGASIQLGFSYRFDFDYPVTFTAQGTGYKSMLDGVDFMGGAFSGTAMYGLNCCPMAEKLNFNVYGGLSMDFTQTKYDGMSALDSTDTTPGISLGLKFNVLPLWTVDASVSHVKEPIIMVGTKLQF